MKWPIFTSLLVLVAAAGWLTVTASPPEVEISSFATTLKGRMASQRFNAELSLGRLTGTVIPPGATFSFNKIVGSFSMDQGYRKAPVSYNGQLVITWGGGVCQTSTTLYNTALLAGMQVTERSRHRFAASYVPPGRDAAVAYDAIDLRFRNPYPFPVRIEGQAEGDRLVIRMFGASKPAERPQITQEVRQVKEPRLYLIGSGAGPSRIRNSGKAGYEVATYRVMGSRRELLSVDSYPTMHKIVERRD